MTLVACLVQSGCPLDRLPLPRHVKPYRQSGSILTVGSSTSATSGPSDGSSSSRPRARIGPPVDPTVSFNPNAQFLCLFDETRRPCAKRGCKERCARCNVPWTVRADLATDQWCANVPKKGSTSYIQVWCAAPGTPSCTESNPSGDLALPHHRPDPHRRTISSSPSCTRPISSLAHELQPSGGGLGSFPGHTIGRERSSEISTTIHSTCAACQRCVGGRKIADPSYANGRMIELDR